MSVVAYFLTFYVLLGRLIGSVAPKTQCPSGSLYENNRNLIEMPKYLRDVNCSRLILDNNDLTTTENSTCSTCDFLSLNNNRFAKLTTTMFSGYPQKKHLSVNDNFITNVEGGVLIGLKVLDIERNPLENLPWVDMPPGLMMSLAGTTIHCSCAMKRALERGVVIETPPNCKGYPGIPYMDILKTVKCLQNSRSQRPQTEAESLNNIPLWVTILMVLLVALLILIIVGMIACCCRYRDEIRRKEWPWIMKRIHRVFWCRGTGDPEKGALDASKMTSASADTTSESSPLSDWES